MKSVRVYIIILSLLTWVSWGFSQGVGVVAKLDTNAMMIGDHVGITLKYTGPAQSKVLWPFLPDTILGHITIIGRGKIDTAYTPDKKSVTFTQFLNLTFYDSGFYTIPSIPFRYRLLPDTTGQVSTSTMLMLAVHTVKVDTTQAIKPIIGPLSVPITFREMLPWIIAALLLAALIVAGIWYFRKRKKQEPIFQLKPKVVLSPYERALQDFEKLRLKKLWQSGKIKEYHSELTEILRRYIEDRFRVAALEQTSSEITENLRDHPDCPRAALDKLNSLLVMADMVKFAKSQPLATENDLCLSDGVDFVRSTSGGAVITAEEVK